MDISVTLEVSLKVNLCDHYTYIPYLEPLQDEDVKHGNSEIFENFYADVSGKI